MISLIHPSRSRAVKSARTAREWINKAGCDVELILSIDNNDPQREFYYRTYSQEWLLNPNSEPRVIAVSNDNRSAVDAINNAAKEANGDILIVVSDDTECPELWGKFLLKWIAGRNDFICKTNDGTQPWIITNPILDRTYYNRFGYIYHPDYQHMFCDTELTCVADLTGRKLTSNILFKHNHYSVTKEPQDHVSKKADATWDQGEKLFLERYKRNFDLPPDQIKGKIQDSNMINWLLRKQRK